MRKCKSMIRLGKSMENLKIEDAMQVGKRGGAANAPTKATLTACQGRLRRVP